MYILGEVPYTIEIVDSDLEIEEGINWVLIVHIPSGIVITENTKEEALDKLYTKLMSDMQKISNANR